MAHDTVTLWMCLYPHSKETRAFQVKLCLYLSALCNKLVSSAHSMLIFECLICAIDLYALKTNNTYQLCIHILH